MNILLHVAALLGGAATNVATGMDTTLGRAFAEHRVPAALAIQAGGVAAVSLVALVGRRLRAPPVLGALAGPPWWAWAGGTVQAVTVFSVLVVAAGASSAALFSASTVTDGTAAAVALDHFGLLGFARRGATLLRLSGCALLVAGTVMVARG